MQYFYKILKKIIYTIRSRIYLIVLLISIFSIFFIYLKLLNIESLLWASKTFLLFIIFQILEIFSAIFIILFLPTYPIFFILIKDTKLNFREKLGITIVSNSSFYIIIGYIGSCFNLPIIFEYFFFTMILTYFLILLIVIFHGYYRGTGFFLKMVKSLDYKQISNGIPKNWKLFNLGLFKKRRLRR